MYHFVPPQRLKGEKMKKRNIITSTLIAAICLTSGITFNHKILNTNELHPMAQWYQENPEQVRKMQQELSSVDYSVAYAADLDTTDNTAETSAITLSRGIPANSESSSTNSDSSTKKSSTNTTSSGKPSSTSSSSKPSTNSSSSSSKPSTSKPSTSKPSGSSSLSSTSKPSSGSTSSSAGTATSSKAKAIISTAKSFLGVPYVWGGQSPSGFDCSGYINYVFGKHGITLPRTAAEQFNVGTSVSKSNLIPGDLVYFTTYKEGPSHVGIYLGNGEFIHASSGKEEVTISNLSSNYYTSRYIGAKRVIK